MYKKLEKTEIMAMGNGGNLRRLVKKAGGRTDRNFAAHQNAGTVGSV